MLLWGVLWIWYYTGCLEYDLVLLNETSYISMFIVLSVLVGAMGKSAQILFHVWLADAMEGDSKVLLKLIVKALFILMVFLVNSNFYHYWNLFYLLVIEFSGNEKDSFLVCFLLSFIPSLKSRNDYLMKAITDLMLSDGHMRNPNKNRKSNKTTSLTNFRMEFTFKAVNAQNESMMPFNNWLKFEVLKDICT